MITKLQSYFQKLEQLSTQELDHSADRLVRGEARNVALLIAHLAEMSRRKAALESGYKSVFDYCVRRLNLSEGSVALRLQVANVARRFPQILIALAENRVSLTVAGMLAPHLDETNVEKLLTECAGMSKRAVEEYIVTLRPKPVFAPSIRKIPEPPRPAPANEIPPPERPQPRPRPTLAPIVAPATPAQFNFRFSAERTFREKLERLAEVLGVENPEKNLAEILERALDLALDRKDPKRKWERRLAKEQAPKTRPDEISRTSRYVASEVRERVHERAGYQCEYRGRDGTRCASRTGLQIEHERPFAIFRSHEERYLRVLCARHNQLRAEQVFGAELVQRRIAESRSKRG